MGEVDDLIGVNAYMDIHALNQLMQEGQTTSGGFLAIDQNQLDVLYSRLKQLPAVANVFLRPTMIEQFQQAIARSQSVMTLFCSVNRLY